LYSLSQIRHLVRIEFSRAQRYGYALSVLALSLDRLPELRDRHGYDFKESAVEDVAALLERRTRACDYLGRLVDDRLMAVLPHTLAEGAASCAARLIDDVARLELDLPGVPGTPGRRAALTLSVGSSSFDGGNAMFFDQLWEAAERALEEAHAAGGGRHLARAPAAG
jgi:diguanylate cyclase (GGDEF)-like protein